MNKNIPWFLCVIFFITACKTKEKTSQLNYMQNVEQVAVEISMKNAYPTVQIGDNLLIYVTAKNMDVVRPFNQNYYSTQTSTAVNAPSSEKPYIVDTSYDIDFPTLGKINVQNKTVEAIKQELTTQISKYVINPTVTVRLANFKVTVLGEVARPGVVTVPEGQTNLLAALGSAGDVTMYADRRNVLIVRNADNEISKHRIDMMDANFINSPYFQLKQNDVIYVASNENKEKVARQDPNTGIYIAVAGMVIGLAGIFITIFKK